MKLQTWLYLRRGRSLLSPCLVLSAVLAAVLVCGPASPTQASLVLSMPASLSPGTGTFDVLIRNDDASSHIIGGFGLRLSAASGNFTLVEIPPSDYIFQDYSFDQKFSAPFSLDVLPASGFLAQDTFWDTLSILTGTALGSGETSILARVSYESDSGVDFVPQIVLSGSQVYTSLFDENGDELPFEVEGGVIPEPGSLLVWSLIAMTGFGAGSVASEAHAWQTSLIKVLASDEVVPCLLAIRCPGRE